MKKTTLTCIFSILFLLAIENSHAAVLVNGMEIQVSNTRGSKEIFYNPYEVQKPGINSAQADTAPDPVPLTSPVIPAVKPDSAKLQAVEQKPSEYLTYQVKPGDTLTFIALDFLGNADMAFVIASINGISEPDRIKPGQTLLIPKPKMGIEYKIELKRASADGYNIYTVDDRYRFKSGDKFRFRLKSNVNGFLYVFNKGSSLKNYMIYPDPRVQGEQYHLTAYEEYTIPSTGWFEFDNKPGAESLILTQSLNPVKQFVPIIKQGLDIPSGRPFALNLNARQWSIVKNRISSVKRPTRDIFLSYDNPAESASPDNPSSGVISQNLNGPEDIFFVEIALAHQ